MKLCAGKGAHGRKKIDAEDHIPIVFLDVRGQGDGLKKRGSRSGAATGRFTLQGSHVGTVDGGCTFRTSGSDGTIKDGAAGKHFDELGFAGSS